MDLNNEKNKIQRASLGKKAKSQAHQAQKNLKRQVSPQSADASGALSQPDSSSEEEAVAQDVVAQFLSKGEKQANEYKEIIEDMMGEYSRYGYAQNTLLGILDYIEENNSITDRQVEAVENIRENPNRNSVW